MAETSLPSAVATEDRGPAILAVSWIECVVAMIIVGARMYTRSYLIHNVGVDDWMILLALVSLSKVSIRLEIPASPSPITYKD